MMHTRKQRRLEWIGQAIDATPIRGDIVRMAFERFHETGELPDETAIANAVTRWALLGEAAAQADRRPSPERHGRGREVRIVVVSGSDEATPPLPSLRECLFDEAVHFPEPIRTVARRSLVVLVDCGADVTDPGLLADREPPKFGSVGWSVLGYPGYLAKAPYKAQAQRLFKRYGDLLDRVGSEATYGWIETLATAAERFCETGVLPDDETVRAGVLDLVEFHCLWEHRAGHDVRDLMAALALAARTRGQDRDDAIACVARLVHARMGSAP